MAINVKSVFTLDYDAQGDVVYASVRHHNRLSVSRLNPMYSCAMFLQVLRSWVALS